MYKKISSVNTKTEGEKMKEEKRKNMLYILGIIALCVVGISIAYAILSTTLTISGTSDVQGVNWEIYFSENDEGDSITTTGGATYTEPTIDGTTIKDYNVSLTKPGDSVSFLYYITNASDITAEVASIVNTTPVCTSSTGNEADAELVCDNLKYTVTTGFEEGDILSKNTGIRSYYCKDNETLSSRPATISITIEYDKNATEVSSSEVTITNLKNEIRFIQSDDKCTKE